jgi:hypothetical protein
MKIAEKASQKFMNKIDEESALKIGDIITKYGEKLGLEKINKDMPGLFESYQANKIEEDIIYKRNIIQEHLMTLSSQNTCQYESGKLSEKCLKIKTKIKELDFVLNLNPINYYLTWSYINECIKRNPDIDLEEDPRTKGGMLGKITNITSKFVKLEFYKPPVIEKTKEILEAENLAKILYDVILYRIKYELLWDKQEVGEMTCIERFSNPLYKDEEGYCKDIFKKLLEINSITMIGFLDHTIPIKEAIIEITKNMTGQINDVSEYQDKIVSILKDKKIDINTPITTEQKISILTSYLEKNKN